MGTAMQSGILLDTSFLIQLAKVDAPQHRVAQDYFELAIRKDIPLYLSALVLAEFEVRQPLRADVRGALRPAMFDFVDGKYAARFQNNTVRDQDDDRAMVRIDTMLMAQAHARQLVAILTNDKNTLAKYLGRLRDKNLTSVQTIVLSDGFDEARLLNPVQWSLDLSLPGQAKLF